MFDDTWGMTWDECIEQFQKNIDYHEDLKRNSPQKYAQTPKAFLDYSQGLVGLISILEQLRDDEDIPEVRMLTSHFKLRIWLGGDRRFEVHVGTVINDKIAIGLSGYENVIVQSEKGAVTIKEYLELAHNLDTLYKEVAEDKIGELEKDFQGLSIEWINRAALELIFSKISEVKLAAIKYKATDAHYPNVIDTMLEGLDNVGTIILKAQEVAREKRSAKWLAELNKDADET